jgi:hypothetical protein
LIVNIKCLTKAKWITEKIRAMFHRDIKKILWKVEDKDSLTTTDDAPIEWEDVHIVYCVAQQTPFEATDEQGVWHYFSC